MLLAVLEAPMADQKPKYQSAKLPYEIMEDARIAAAFRNAQIGDMLSEILGPILKDIIKTEIAKREANSAKEAKTKRGQS